LFYASTKTQARAQTHKHARAHTRTASQNAVFHDVRRAIHIITAWFWDVIQMSEEQLYRVSQKLQFHNTASTNTVPYLLCFCVILSNAIFCQSSYAILFVVLRQVRNTNGTK